MWQRFAEGARKAVFYAQEEAQEFGVSYVSTEHLLLGLVREADTVAARVLDKLGVSLGRVRVEVEKQLPRGDQRSNHDMTLTSRAKRVIDLAYDEARNLNNNYIGTEHILLGLVREGDGLAGRVLAKLGISLEPARFEVMNLQDAESQKPRPSGSQPFHPEPTGMPMTETARRVPALAVQASQTLGEGLISTEHILLGLLHDPASAASRILQALDIAPADVCADIVERSAVYRGGTWNFSSTPRVSRVISIAEEEAKAAQASNIDTGHLLLGVFLEEEGLGAKVLRDHMADVDKLRGALAAQSEPED